MPPAAFEHMWSTLKSGRSWMGLVKNRCKNGDHYWVSAYVTPIAKNGSIVEYQSVRTKPEPEQVLAAEKLYAQLRSGKAARPKLAASFSVKILLLIWGSIISSAMAAGMLTDTSISSLLLATLMSGSLSSVSVLAILSVLFLADGCIEEQGAPAQLFHQPKSPRLQYFLSSWSERQSGARLPERALKESA